MSENKPDHQRIIAVVKPLMIAAARIAMDHYKNLGEVQYKSDKSPLTDADPGGRSADFPNPEYGIS